VAGFSREFYEVANELPRRFSRESDKFVRYPHLAPLAQTCSDHSTNEGRLRRYWRCRIDHGSREPDPCFRSSALGENVAKTLRWCGSKLILFLKRTYFLDRAALPHIKRTRCRVPGGGRRGVSVDLGQSTARPNHSTSEPITVTLRTQSAGRR
jgi:hypothetical protein